MKCPNVKWIYSLCQMRGERHASCSIFVQRFYWQSEAICLFLPAISQRAEEFQYRRHVPLHAMQYKMRRHIGGQTFSSADSMNIIMVWNAEF